MSPAPPLCVPTPLKLKAEQSQLSHRLLSVIADT